MPELVKSIHKIFKHCNVREGERVVVYTDSGRQRELPDLFMNVAAGYGCDATQIWGELRQHMTEPARAAVAAMKTADIVFDVTSKGWLYTASRGEIMDTGTVRMLQVLPPETMLLERPPHPDVIRRAKLSKPLFDNSDQTVHITSDLGTDLRASFKGRPVNPEDGAVEKAGEWDSQGMGFVNCFPIEDSAEGTVVLNGPFHFSAGAYDLIPEQPVKVTIRAGRVVKVEGGTEARMFERWLDSWNDPKAKNVAHLGIGYDHRNGPIPKPVSAGDQGSWESTYGGVVVAFGANRGRSGGQNIAPNHCDLVVLGATYSVGGRDLIRNGECLLDSITA
jgi:2,5-dihydroxypyridine 5,6-dioxygenase